MTKAQENKIEKVKGMVDAELLHTDEYEIKTFEIHELDYFVSVVLETGLKNDEGTMASILCRDRAHLFIWKGGKITYPVSKTLKNGKFKAYDKPFKSLLGTVLDQNH